VTPADYAKFCRSQARDLEDKVDRALGRAAAAGAKLARQRTRTVHAVATGRFADNWQPEDRENGWAIVNPTPYAGYADDGRPPGSPPPVTALVRWAEKKLRVAGPAAWAVAHKIAQDIAARGIRGAHVLQWLTEKLELVIPNEIEKELSR